MEFHEGTVTINFKRGDSVILVPDVNGESVTVITNDDRRKSRLDNLCDNKSYLGYKHIKTLNTNDGLMIDIYQFPKSYLHRGV